MATQLFKSQLLEAHPVTAVFTGKPLSFGGPGQLESVIGENRERLRQHLRLSPAFRLPGQVHGQRIAYVTDEKLDETDAIIVHRTGMPVALQFADCVPIVLYSPRRHVGAVVHAGWKGTAQNITAKTVERLSTELSAEPSDLLAVIGPAIGGCCFEVGPEVVDALATTMVDQVLPAYCITGSGPNHNPKVDLKQVNVRQLQQTGVTQIEVLPACTHCMPDRLWSHRRGEKGRQLAVLCLT